MPLPSEIAQYPPGRHLKLKRFGRQKPRPWWGYSPQRLEAPWNAIARPYYFLPMWETFAATNPSIGFRDISGYGRNGTISVGQAPAFAGSEMGGSYKFDEVDDRISTTVFTYEPDQATVTPALTILFWFRLTDLTGSFYQYVFSQGPLSTTSGGINIYFTETGPSPPQLPGSIRCKVTLNGGAGKLYTVDAGSWDDGKWHSYVLTLTSANVITIYVDGVLKDGPDTNTGAGYNPANVLRIGCNGDSTPNADRFFGGQLSMFAIMKGAWTAEQVRRWNLDPWVIVRPKRGLIVNYTPPTTQGTGPEEILPEELGPMPYDVF